MELLRSRVITLDANGNAIDHIQGAVLIVESISAGASVDITWLDSAGNDAGAVAGVLVGRQLKAGGIFYGLRVAGAAGAVVVLMIGPEAAASYNTLTQSVVIGHVIVDAPMPSTPVTGPVTNAELRAAPVPVTSAGTLGGTLTNVAPVACTAVIAAALAVSATRRAFFARNLGPNNVALVAAAGTYANAAIVLLPGETWREELAPGAAWYAICDAAETATLNLLTAA